jgi:CrcB protein
MCVAAVIHNVAVTRFLLICAGGAAGTGARYLLSLWITAPYATLLVNLIGSFLLGLLMHASLLTLSPDTRLVLGTGLLGGFTTYSTFNYDMLALLRSNSWGAAGLYAAATLVGCLAAGALGIVIGRAFAN